MHVRSTVGLHKHPVRYGLAGLAVLALGLTACSSSSGSNTSDSSSASGGSGGSTAKGSPITIGIVAAETGAYGAYGLGDEKGIEAQIDLVNASGGILGHQVKLDNIDDQSDPSKAVIGVQKLLSESPAPLMIHCGAISADCAPLLPYTGRAKVITMTPAATPDFGDPSKNPYTFRTSRPSSRSVVTTSAS
jgi:ABC-type branched-subunit amino acid transport system substrate-binding protein